MPIYLQILLTLAGVLGAFWVSVFLGELVAWRRGIASLTDTPPLPPESTARRKPAWWEYVCWWVVFIVFVVPIAAFALILVAPPVYAVSLLARRTDK
jgi:hypothetical protein